MSAAQWGARLSAAALHVILFFIATAWGFRAGYEVDGAWLGMLMGLNGGVCAILLLNGVQNAFKRWAARGPEAQ